MVSKHHTIYCDDTHFNQKCEDLVPCTVSMCFLQPEYINMWRVSKLRWTNPRDGEERTQELQCFKQWKNIPCMGDWHTNLQLRSGALQRGEHRSPLLVVRPSGATSTWEVNRRSSNHEGEVGLGHLIPGRRTCTPAMLPGGASTERKKGGAVERIWAVRWREAEVRI